MCQETPRLLLRELGAARDYRAKVAEPSNSEEDGLREEIQVVSIMPIEDPVASTREKKRSNSQLL